MAAGARKKPGAGAGPMSENVVPLRPSRPCPICCKKSTQAFHPFCSKHCADVDLNRWLNGAYAIPATEPPDNWDGSEPAGEDGEDER